MTEPGHPVPLETLLAHRAWVRAVARALVADRNDADDVEQQAWLLALERPPRHAMSVRGWLGAVTRNVARKLGRGATRRARHETAATPPPGAAPVVELVAEAELQQRIGRAVLDLDEPFRATVLLRYFDGLPAQDVAARLGVPLETVRSRLRLAHARLRARLDEGDGGRRGAWALAVLAWGDGPFRDAPPVVPSGTGAAAGGVAMAISKKLLAAAVLLAAIGATTWTSVRDAATPPLDTGDMGTPPPDTAATASGRPARTKRNAPLPVAADVPRSEDALPAPVDLDAADRDLDLHGRVVTADDQPVAGARVAAITYPWRRAVLLNHRDYDQEAAGPATRAAIDGTFSLRLARGQSVALRIGADGFATVELPHVLAGERVRVVLRPGVRLVATITDSDGAPVVGAAVRLRAGDHDDAAPAFVAVGTSGAGGVCTIDGLPPGARAFASVEHREAGTGFWTQVDLPPTGELKMDLRMKPARILRGRVVDAETKAPIVGAEIGMNWTFELAVRTQADGSYELPGWTAGGHNDVHVRAEGYATDGSVVGASERVDFELARGYAVAGRVVGADGQAVQRAIVGLIAAPMGREEGEISHGYAITDADGRFRVTSLRVGMRHVIVVLAPGHARLRVETPTARTTQDVDLGDVVLPVPRRVEGVVIGAGDVPQRRLTVFLSGPSTGDDVGSFYGRSVTAATDDLGRFRFDDVAPGSYSIVVRPPGGQEIRTKVEVRADADLLGVRVERAAVRTVTISVTDPDGKSLPGVYVGLTDSQNRSIQARTDAAGVAQAVVPEGASMRWSVYPPQDTGRTFLQPPWRELPQDASELRVALEEPASVTGRVLDPDGAPVAGAWFRLVDAGGAERWSEAGTDGSFLSRVSKGSRSTLLFDGAVNVAGKRTDSCLVARVEGVEPGDGIVVVRCTRVAMDRTLTVVVVSPQGEPVPKASIGLHGPNASYPGGVYPQTDESGRVTVKDLPARDLNVSVHLTAADFIEPARVTVVPDGQELRLVCRTASRITGTVVGKDGAPLPWGHVRAERRGEYVFGCQAGRDGRFVVLLPETDTAPVRLVIDRNNDGTPEASLDDVRPGTPDVRLVVK